MNDDLIGAAQNRLDVTIDNIGFNTARDLWMETSDPVDLVWTCRQKWSPFGHVYEWVLIDKGIGIHADAWWICGHYQLDDYPGMLLAGVAQITNNLGSMLANAYRLDDNIGQALVQGWRLDNQPGMVMCAEEFLIDNPGAVIIGAEQITNTPGMILVYGVNRDGAIFVNVIDDNTYQALLDEGITFS